MPSDINKQILTVSNFDDFITVYEKKLRADTEVYELAKKLSSKHGIEWQKLIAELQSAVLHDCSHINLLEKRKSNFINRVNKEGVNTFGD